MGNNKQSQGKYSTISLVIICIVFIIVGAINREKRNNEKKNWETKRQEALIKKLVEEKISTIESEIKINKLEINAGNTIDILFKEDSIKMQLYFDSLKNEMGKSY